MAKRRGDNPLTILVMGIFTIAVLGGIVAHYGSSKPILRLPPELAKKYGYKDFKARFVPSRSGLRSFIIVEVPQPLADTKDRLKVGAFALDKYVELAEGQTQVESCHVAVRNRPDITSIIVSESLMLSEETTRKAATGLELRLKGLGLRRPRITVVGIHLTGTEIRVKGVSPDSERVGDLAKKVMKVLIKEATSVSLIELTVESRDKKKTVTLIGGRDAPKGKPDDAKKPSKTPPTKAPKKAD